MMNQGFTQLLVFVVSCAFTQEVYSLKIVSDNSVPIVGGNLTISCLATNLFNDGNIYWFHRNGTELSKCYTNNGGWCFSFTSNYSFTANISGAYAYIDGLDRIRDGGTWKCMHCYGNTCHHDTVDIVVYTAPSGVNLVKPIPKAGDLGVESITLMCQTVDCTFPTPNITWYYMTYGQITSFIGFSGYTNTSTSQCPQQEAIYTSTLHLSRGTNFSGNIPLTTKFLCGLTNQSVGEKMRYSNVSNDVTFAVHVSKVILIDSESGTHVCYEGFPQTLKCVTSPARPVPIIQWFLQTNNATNASSLINNITEMNTTNNDGLHVTESEITIIPRRYQRCTIYCVGNIVGQHTVMSNIVDIEVLYTNYFNASPLVAAVVGIIVTAMMVILGIAAVRILMTTRIFATNKSCGAYHLRTPIRSLRDDIGAVYENMPVLNANVKVDNEYVNTLAVRRFGADLYDDAESVYENRDDVDLSVLRSNGYIMYADLELAIPRENNGQPIIHGLQNRTDYAEIAFYKRGEPLPDSDDEKESLETHVLGNTYQYLLHKE